jgi:hypothetical protein
MNPTIRPHLGASVALKRRRIIYTDLDDLTCKVTEESQLPCRQGLARPRRSVI